MAKKSNVTLEDFIKNYNASKKRKQKTYSQWLSEQGDLSEVNYAEAVNEAQKEYDRAKAGYGKTGEVLSQSGLNGSGYASFLDSNAYSELQNSKREAEKERRTASIKNRSAYAEYLEKEDSEQNRLVGDTVADIYRYGSSNYESSYKLAIAAGLDEETAKHAAEIGIALNAERAAAEAGKKGTVSASARRTLLKDLIEKRLTGEKAIAYLVACGISEAEAEQMAEAAEKTRTKQNNAATDIFG